VGGAERANRKRKQQATQAVRSARAATGGPGAPADRRRVITAVAVLLALAAVVVGGVLWQRSRSAPPPATAHQVTTSYPVRMDGSIVVAGADTARVTVDAYEDFLCPACGAFEKRDGSKIEQGLTDGTVRVRYHVLNLLDDRSNPPGYSLEAGAAALCAADAAAFPSYHGSLFANQPREGGRGYTADQLIQLGHDVGIPSGSFDSCVRDGTHKADVSGNLQQAMADPSLRRGGSGGASYFGTPTVVVNGSVVDLGNAAWLDDAIHAAAS
jgi:protein-disulfide isomerase